MSALSIQPTFPTFADVNGQPLDNGYIWLGAANLDPQTNPVQVYWDAALTIAAPQPIRTLNGYPSRSGAPGRLYVNSDYSIRVQNSKGSLVYSAQQVTERYGNIINADGVIYDPPFTGGVQTNVEAKLAQTVSVKDFGAVGDGVTDDTVAIQAAITAAAGGKLIFPTAPYKFTTPLSIQNIDVDFQGSSLFYAGAPGAFALSLTSNAGAGTNQTAGNVFENFTLYQNNFAEYVTVTASTTWDPPSVPGGATLGAITPNGASTTVSVPGATAGGYARATLSTLTEGMALTAWVSAPGTVTVWLSNYTFGAVDLASGTLNITVVNNAYHGLAIGGVLGTLKNAKVQGFTGVSFGAGGPITPGNLNGRDPVSGVMFGASSKTYYWDVDVNVAAAAGWAGIIPQLNNENVFKFGTFPLNAYGDAVPRRAPTINQLVISGIGNKFQRTSLESSSSEETLVLYYGANQCDLTQGVYIETNTSWVTSPFPRVFARGTASANKLNLRHPYSGASAIRDLGFANYLIAPPSFYVNGAQVGQPAKGRNLVVNGDFENGLTGWSDFSSGGFVTTVTGTGRVSGKRVRVDLTAGRINLTQNLLTANGFSTAGLDGCNVTVCGWIKTNVDNIALRINGLTNANVEGDGVERFFVTTARADAACNISIYNAANRTGYVEFSNITAYVGNEAGMVAERTQPVGSATYNPPSIAAVGQATTTVSVPGAALGDIAMSSFSLDLQGIELSAYVSAVDTVTCLFKNGTAGAIDLGSGTLRCRLIKA